MPWRNYTMHEHTEYTEDKAKRIFSYVEGFMKDLASSMYFIN